METIKATSGFFVKDSPVYHSLDRITRRLAEEGIDYAILGGMALVAHGYVRYTDDIDILVTADGLERIHERLVGRGYVAAFPGAWKTLRDVETGVRIEFLTTGEYPGDGKPKPVAFPTPADVSVERDGQRVVELPKLIELKLASGMTAVHRMRDLSDVVDLIMRLGLPRELGEQLDASVRDEYFRLWDASR